MRIRKPGNSGLLVSELCVGAMTFGGADGLREAGRPAAAASSVRTFSWRENEHEVLMVLTSHDQLGNTGHKTGFWLEEFAAPYYVFKDAGADVTVASPKGGQPPIDPKSDEPGRPDRRRRAASRRIAAAQAVLANTVSWPTSAPPTTTPSSIPAATARCGTWPRIAIRSP